MTPGRFIAFEGIDGCGKSTAARTIAERIRASGRGCLITEEPTDRPVGRRIREMLSGKAPMVEPLALQRLFVEDRREHIERVILPALRAGTAVVTDRYWLSTVAYGMLDHPMERLIALHEEILGKNFLRPDRTFLLDLEPAVALDRMQRSRHAFTHFEQLEKLARIRTRYRALAAARIDRITIIDATRAPDTVAATIWEELSPLLR